MLTRVRDPFALFPALSQAGFATPRLVPQGQRCPSEGRWLRKPLRSGGGLGLRSAQPGEAASHDHFFQDFIAGQPMSALFVNADLFGCTEQLIGESWLHAPPFVYCGNVGRYRVPKSVTHTLAELGRSLANAAGLRGVWGLDFVLREEAPYPLEVNPRYAASAEVLEHATGTALFGEDLPPQPPSPLVRGAGGVGLCVGKAIYYTPHTFRFPPSGPWDADLAGTFDPWRLPQFADIPEAASVIEAGWPVLTLFATGSTPRDVRERLQSRAGELDLLFRDLRP
ncbi:ATP-grasp domain-containing protein [Frigoriglobus tundricola]|uniref:ATP-grasp domain-containing protein n=1 Tax=Frigoriglobus tundricola TaxID=2774151 RepID=UPI00148EC365